MQSGMVIGVPGYCRIEFFENVEVGDHEMHVSYSMHLTCMVGGSPLDSSGKKKDCLNEHFLLLYTFLILKMRAIVRPYMGDGGGHIELNGGSPLVRL